MSFESIKTADKEFLWGITTCTKQASTGHHSSPYVVGRVEVGWGGWYTAACNLSAK